ncbi:MAG: hypothetical protein GXY83_04300 [Rhodopirellula sp.]|nr:hypothetical protein [Rhodopirellula sp.]
MVRAFDLPEDIVAAMSPENHGANDPHSSPAATLKAVRYIVASVDESALKVWEELWREFQKGVTPVGAITAEMEQGFQPSCGWPEFLEKFWLLKHYLDYIHRFCREASDDQP